MSPEQLREHIDTRLDKLEDKLDAHLERISATENRLSKSETDIHWIRGSIKIGVTLLLAALSGLAAIVFGR